MKKIALLLTILFTAAQIYATDVRVLITDKKNTKITISGAATMQAKGSSSKKKVSGTITASKAATITPQKDTVFTINGNQYNGILTINPAVGIIETLDLETYLYGVLPYEMSPSWPLEALKAQAVAARTYTLKELEAPKNKNFDLYSDVRSQMYKGSVKRYDSVQKAVDGTKAQVLAYNGKTFYTYYHANCGGHTDAAPWLKDPIKPLQGNTCGYCAGKPNSTWAYTVPKTDINNFLRKNKINGTIKSVKIAKKFKSGRAKTSP